VDHEECSKLMAGDAECGPYFMFSEAYPSWGCKCCGQKAGSGGVANKRWDIYRSTAWVDRWFEENCDSDWLATISHADGLCATADGSTITPDHDIKWLSGKAFEATYSNGNGGDYNQTFALGPPGKYIGKEGGFSNVIWEGHAKVQYTAKTTVTLEMFVKAIQEQSIINNRMGTYSWETNNCQDFTDNVLQLLHLEEYFWPKMDPHRADLTSLIAAGAACTVPGIAQAASAMGWCGDAHRGVNPQCQPEKAPQYNYDGAKMIGPIKQCLTNDCGSYYYANFNPVDYKCKAHKGVEAEWNACKSGYHPHSGWRPAWTNV